MTSFDFLEKLLSMRYRKGFAQDHPSKQKEAFGVERDEVVLDAGHDRPLRVSPSVWRWNDPTRVRRDLEDEWVKLYQKANKGM